MTSIRLQRLDHVSLNVSDRPRSIEWYRRVLGLEPRGEAEQDDWPVFMGEFGACLALFQARTEAPERPSESPGLRHVAFVVGVADLERAQARLRADGIEFRFEDHGDAHSVYFSDPDGNVIELTMRVRSPAPAR
jgi:catechol-2,3-dioxygenase